MEILFLNSSPYDVPSSRRVGAIVHDGAADMRLWPGPGADRELDIAYGDGLGQALEVELKQLGVDELPLFDVARVHPGRLHCDFLAWVATRGPEPGTAREPAPDGETLAKAVRSVLDFVAKRTVVRVAFPALGGGPGELSADERLAVIVRAATAYQEECFAAGRSPVVEEVLVCEASSTTLSAARRKVQSLAKTAALPAPVRGGDSDGKKARPKRASKGGRKKKEPARPSLAPDEIASARASAEPYDMRRIYMLGDHFVHPRFGVGRVEQITPEGAISVVFEDGSIRKMVHARA